MSNESESPIIQIYSAVVAKHEEWISQSLAQCGYTVQEWQADSSKFTEIMDELEEDPGYNTLDNSQVHTGPLLGAAQFAIRSVFTDHSVDPVPNWNDDDSYATVQRGIRLPKKIVDVTTLFPTKSEDWAVVLTPDSPPYAIAEEDARYVHTHTDAQNAALLVRSAFGNDAVPLLSNSETRLLAQAIIRTPLRD